MTRSTTQTLAAAALALAAMLSPTFTRAASEVAGKVTHVTLYRDQAQVTRSVPIAGAAGPVELVVGVLPEQVVAGSLFAEGGDDVEIRAVRFRTRAVGEAPREEVRKLDDQIADVQRQIELTQKKQALLAGRTAYLDKLENFIAPTAHNDLNKGVLDADALEKITIFVFAEREKIAEDDVKLSQQTKELAAQLDLLNRQRAEITSGASKTVREAVLFVEKRAGDAAEVRLNYLVGNCGWSPSYTMRSTADRKQVRVEYNALIHQITGEDWKDVTLTLSTASPTLAAAGPGLAPFHVILTTHPTAEQQAQQGGQSTLFFYGQGMTKGQVIQQLEGLNSQRSLYNSQANNSAQFDEQNRFNWSVNDVACTVQQLELNGDAIAINVLRTEAKEAEGPSLTYQLRGGVSLATRNDQQMVRIMQTDMPSNFYHVAVPVLNSLVYREAELKNSSEDDLLAGPMTVYLGDHFVGQGEIPTVARGQMFVVGFGSDPQLRARRELVDKEDNLQGGNRETKFKYRLVIENFSGSTVPLRVLDRLPHAENGADIKITLGETSDALSSEKLYQREERPMGLLRWDVEAKPETSGDDARLITYAYAVEYDRQYVLSLPESKQRLQEEFERLQRGRQKR